MYNELGLLANERSKLRTTERTQKTGRKKKLKKPKHTEKLEAK